jgi:hypothetical protein
VPIGAQGYLQIVIHGLDATLKPIDGHARRGEWARIVDPTGILRPSSVFRPSGVFRSARVGGPERSIGVFCRTPERNRSGPSINMNPRSWGGLPGYGLRAHGADGRQPHERKEAKDPVGHA